MARFVRDEKRRYPILWLMTGGLFFGSAAWALKAELVDRVPWQVDQKAFYELELKESEKALTRAKDEWEKQIQPSLQDKLDRKEKIEADMKAGDYAQAKQRVAELDQNFAAAELGKTFGTSDLDEAYYYRNLAEYERDAAARRVREAFRAGAEDTKAADATVDAIYADSPAEAAKAANPEATPKIQHLETEIARMKGHIAHIEAAIGDDKTPAGARAALGESKRQEQVVIDALLLEVKHQGRVDKALRDMADIDGPAEPIVTERDPAKQEAERARLYAEVCKGHEDTRNCLKWLKLGPVEAELKGLEIDIAKRKRGLVDAQLRFDNADRRARPKFDPGDLIGSLVGPFQIQQVVTQWIAFDRPVDIEQVDRCQTCHMGTDNGSYMSASLPRQFRTHPNRSRLLSAHPVEKFGCTSCHQGQGRATEFQYAHSAWRLHEHVGEHGEMEELWHFDGDHYWEDPLLPIGALRDVVVDDHNDELKIKVNKGKWESVKIAHRNPTTLAAEGEGEGHDAHDGHHAASTTSYATEAEFLGHIQEAGEAALPKDLTEKWRFVVRKIDNRIQIGVEAKDPDGAPAKETPVLQVQFPDADLATTLGFDGIRETTARVPLQIAPLPPAVPIRSDGMASLAADGKFTPPRGDLGLQVPDDQRNRFIVALPEVESGCFRCHQQDVDLRPRGSRAAYVSAKLGYQKAEAERAKDPAAYKRAHDGSEDLPQVPQDPLTLDDMAPTYAEGRELVRRLNCTGCHILDNFPWDRNAGPSLDNVSAKVTPEWLLTWVRNPRGWRPKTRMPNLWPKPLDPASKRPYADNAPEMDKWRESMREETVAIASYLFERSEKPTTRPGNKESADAKPLREQIAGYADVADATAERGKAVFESYGCQGCHARSDADSAAEKLPEPWRGRERDIAPTLSNLANKTTADWIAFWVEDPARYWHGTKMPNLRLSRRDAASVGKYLTSLKSTSPNPAQVDAADVKLVSDEAKRNERVPCSNQGGRLMTRVECGEKLIAYYGCFGCHQVSGFEKSSPIAPELGGFAKKDVTTLDFGYAIADHHLQTTETFATLKLDSPRIYRRDRIELKMADYDLSPREIRAIVTFLKGLVPAKPKEAWDPAKQEKYAAALKGRQLVEDYNCRGCHVIEDRGGDIDNFRAAQLGADGQARAPFLAAEGSRVQPEWLFAFLREPGKNGIRPWLHPEWAWGEDLEADKMALRMPTFNFDNEQVTAIVRYFASWDGQEYPYQAPKAKELTEEEKLYTLTHMNSPEAANCLSCHFAGEFPVQRGQTELAKMAPNLNMVHKRLRPDWVKQWLLRPANFLPYTKMTGFWATKDRPKSAANWPEEQDPFLSPPAAGWDKVPFRAVTGEEQAELVRDFLFSLKPDSVFPAKGEEANSPLVKPIPVDAKKAETDEKDKAEKGKEKKTTGAVLPATRNL